MRSQRRLRATQEVARSFMGILGVSRALWGVSETLHEVPGDLGAFLRHFMKFPKNFQQGSKALPRHFGAFQRCYAGVVGGFEGSQVR